MYFVGDYIQILHCLDLHVIQYEMIFFVFIPPPPIKNMFIYTFIYKSNMFIYMYMYFH